MIKFEEIIDIKLIIFDYLNDILIDSRSSRENIEKEKSNIRNKKYI